MHIILMIIGVIGAAGLWWYRMKAAGQAANEVADALGRVRGNVRRKRARDKAALAPLTSITDPVVAAATVAAAIATDDGAMSDAQEDAYQEAISAIAAPGKLDEVLIYGKWAANKIDDSHVVIDHTARFLSDKLEDSEKLQLLELVNQAASAGGGAPAQLAPLLARLRQKLGLVMN